MFWNSAGTTSNVIDQVLDEPTVTLQTILEQDEVLQELRAMNKKLVEFLSRPESLSGMVDLITTEPAGDVPIALQYKLPNFACEVLTSDNSFVEKVTGDKNLLETLFHFFRDNPTPINPLLASYVCRVLGEIISRKLDQNWYSYQLNLIQIMGYLQSEAGILSWLLKHMDCSAVCEFFFKLMINIEGPDMRNSLYEWMIDREMVITRFAEKMTRQELEEVHANVSRLVGDLLFAFQDELINSSQDRSADADPFLIALRSHETISTLLRVIFSPDAICETSIMHGLDLVLSLLGVTRSNRQSGRNDSLDESNDGIILSEAIKLELLARMPTLLNLLQSPVDPNPLPMTFGLLEKPVGLGRLAIAKFIAHLFTLNDDELNMGMIQSGVLKQLLDLFWLNPWNNFLHRYVCKIMACIAKSAQVSPGSASFLMDVGLLTKILEVFENKELKCGYRGHLAKVASVWGEAALIDTDGVNVIKDLMQKLEQNDKELYTKWDAFYSNTLENYFSSEKVLLAGVHPPASGGILSSGGGASMPYSETDTSFSTGVGSMPWLEFSAQSMLNVDFDPADSLLNLTIGGGDDSPSKSKSLFEMFCSEKTNSFDDDEDNDDEDDGMRKKNSFDLSSPDSDSLEEDKWTEAESKLNLGMNLSFPGEDDAHALDDIFADNTVKSPSVQIPILGADPWSNLEPGSNAGGAGDDPWSNPESIFGPGSHTTNAQNKAAIADNNGDWAQFDQIKELASTPPVDDEWANFESAVAAVTPTLITSEEKCVVEVSSMNTDKGEGSNSIVDVVNVGVNIETEDIDPNMQQFQSSSAKDETVSASQQVSAAN